MAKVIAFKSSGRKSKKYLMALAVTAAAGISSLVSVARAGLVHWNGDHKWDAANWRTASAGSHNDDLSNRNTFLETSGSPVTTITHIDSVDGYTYSGADILTFSNAGYNFTHSSNSAVTTMGPNAALAGVGAGNPTANTYTHASTSSKRYASTVVNWSQLLHPSDSANSGVRSVYGTSSNLYSLKNPTMQSYNASAAYTALYSTVAGLPNPGLQSMTANAANIISGLDYNLQNLSPQNSNNVSGLTVSKNQSLLDNPAMVIEIINAHAVTIANRVAPQANASDAAVVTLSGSPTDAKSAASVSTDAAGITLSGTSTAGKDVAANSAALLNGTVLLASAATVCPGGLADPWFDAAGGTKTWDASTTANWSTTQVSPSYTNTWSAAAIANGDATGGSNAVATFQGTAGTVTVSGAVSVGGMTFSVSGYTLNGTGTLTLGRGGIIATVATGLTTISTPLSLTSAQPWTAITNGTLTVTGTVTRNVGSTVDFSTAGVFNGAGLLTAVGTTVQGWATIGGTDWAISNGTQAAAIGTYQTTTAGGNTVANYTGKDVDVTSSPTLASVTVNSLRFNTAAAETFTNSGTTIITSGGILVTSAVGGNLSTITGGTIEGANSKDLVIIQNNTSKGLTIASVIADNTGATGLTKSGAGTLTITNSGNSFTGNITVNQGVLKTGTDTGSQTGVLGNPNTAGRQITIASGATLIFGNHDTFGGWAAAPAVTLNINGTVTNSGPWVNVLGAVNFNGGTLAAIDGYNNNGITAYVLQTGFNVTVTGSAPSTITLSGATNPRLALRGAVTFNVADVTGDANADLIVTAPLSNHPDNTVGSLVKSGAGTMLFNGAVQSTYSGGTTINAGALIIDESNITGNANLLLNTGALTLSGGNLTIKGKTGITAAQTFSGITLTAGTIDSITLNANTGTAANLTSTAALVQNAGSTLFLDLSAAGSGAFLTNMTASTAAPWATVKDSGGTGVGTINASKQLVRVTSFTALPASGAVGTTDYNLTLNSNTTTAGSLNLILTTATESASSLTVDTTAGAGTFNLSTFGLNTTDIYISQTSGTNTFQVTGTGALGTSGSVLYLHNYNAGLVTIAAPISGAGGGLTVDGTGTTSLTATSTYTGVTTINSGTLQIGGAGLLNSGSYAGNIINNGSLVQASSANQTFSGSISGAGSLLQSGISTLTLSGANTYTGGTTVSGGTIKLSGTGTLGNTSGSLAVNTGGTLDVNGTTQTVGSFSGTGGTITNSTAGSVYFSIGNNNTGGGTFAGSITAGTGTIALDKIGNNTITLSGTSSVAGVQVNSATVGGMLELSGTLTSTGGFNYVANGVGGNNNGITNDFGTLQLDNGSLFTVNGSPGDVFLIARTSGTGVLTQNGGTFNYNPTTNLNLDVSYQGTGTYNMNGGTLTLNGRTLNLDGSTGSGTFNLNGGLVQAVNITASGGTTTFNFNGGTLQASGTAASLLTGITSAFVKSGGAIVDTNNFNATIAQPLLDGTGGGGLTKIGAGILTLTGSNTYTGVTTLTAGTLNLGVAETAGTAGPLGKSAAANAGSIFMGGGTLQYSASNNNDYSGRLSTATGQSFNIDTNGQSVNFGTALQGANNTLTKLGTGSLTISGASANTYTGLTTVTAGVLILSKTAGVAAIPGNLAINGTTSSSDVWFTANNQLGGANTVVSSVNSTGVAPLTLLSTTQTIAGLSSPSGGLMVDNTSTSTGSNAKSPSVLGTGTLILVGAGSYTDAGWIWDGWDNVSGSTLALVVNMGAGGTQTLSPPAAG